MKLAQILKKSKKIKNLSDLKSKEIEYLIKCLKWKDCVIISLSILCCLLLIF